MAELERERQQRPLAVGVFLAEDDEDAPASPRVFFTRRGKRLCLAHAIYHDGSI